MVRAETVNILLVDDREENLLAFSTVLSSPEYHVICATSGPQALEILHRHDFAVILMDVLMPGMDGLETAKRVRALERSKTTPIILVTGMYPDEAHIRLGYEVGAVDFISKPFDPRVMQSKVAVFVDLFRKTEKIRAQEKLLAEASESRFRTLFEQSPLAIQLISPQGVPVAANPAWGKLWGGAETSAAKILEAAVRKAQAGENSELPPIELLGKWIASYIYPVRNEQGDIREVAVTLKDVTDRESMAIENARLYQEAEAQRAHLQKAVLARDEFISIASHELRTPVTALVLHSEMATLQMEHSESLQVLRDRLEKFVAVSNSQLDRLSRLIDEMLDVSRMSVGRLILQMENVELNRVVGNVIHDFSGHPGDMGSQITFAPGAAVQVCGDSYRLEQVVTNLLTNAIKYGEGRPIQVSVVLEQDAAVIQVKDQGLGIALEDQARIFDRFERAVDSTSITGLGLGLYIVKKIVEAHSGKVSVQSALGQGSVFTVKLPLEQGCSSKLSRNFSIV